MEIRLAPLEDTLYIRERLLSAGQPWMPVLWPYDDESAVHYGCFQREQLIGCVSVHVGSMQDSDPATSYRFHSMGVEEEWQHHGIGRAMLARVANDLLDQGAELLWGTAPAVTVGFFLACGFTPWAFIAVEPVGYRLQYVTADRAAMQELAGSI